MSKRADPCGIIAQSSAAANDRVLNLHATTKAGKFATLTFDQALLSKSASGRRLAPGQMPQSVPLVASSGQGQAARVRVRAEIQRNPRAVADPTSNFVTPQVTAPQQQLMIQRLLESGESGQLPP